MSFPIILSSPSGGGKTTIAHGLLKLRHDAGYSVSCTTRTPRAGEEDGKDYHFRSEADFRRGVEKGEFAEWATVHGHLYGTLRAEVEKLLSANRHVVMDIDVQGAKQFSAAFPESVLIFILPPSAEVLLRRLRARATEGREELDRRLRGAREELKALDSYTYVVVNDDIETAVRSVSAIVDAECVKYSRTDSFRRKGAELIRDLDIELGKNH